MYRCVQGVTAKLHVAKQGQQVSVPILLSSDSRDWTVLIAATVVPPLLGTAIHFGIIRPLMRRYRLSQVTLQPTQSSQSTRVTMQATRQPWKSSEQQQLLESTGYAVCVKAVVEYDFILAPQQHLDTDLHCCRRQAERKADSRSEICMVDTIRSLMPNCQGACTRMLSCPWDLAHLGVAHMIP